MRLEILREPHDAWAPDTCATPRGRLPFGWLCLYEFYEYLDTWSPIGQDHGDTQLKMQVALFQ